MEKKTPLYEQHVALKGRIVPFAGYLLPVQYPTGVIAEHMAVRQHVGLFDVSHMGEALIEGPQAEQALNYILSNQFTGMPVGKARYSLMLNEAGGVVDDLIVYRRSEKELPARAEEVHHAKEEGILFRMLTNPVEVLGDERGWVRGVRCVEMELGEPDESGRRSPVVKPGSEFDIDCDVVIMALGTSPNPLLASTTKGLETNRRGCIMADAEGATTRPGVFAGGDAVTGAATGILAMGAGRTAARAIDKYIKSRKK